MRTGRIEILATDDSTGRLSVRRTTEPSTKTLSNSESQSARGGMRSSETIRQGRSNNARHFRRDHLTQSGDGLAIVDGVRTPCVVGPGCGRRNAEGLVD